MKLEVWMRLRFVEWMSGYAHLPTIRTTSKHSISVHLRVVLSCLYPYATKSVNKRARGRVATTVSVATTKDVRSYWIGRRQKMWKKVGSKWGILRQLGDLQANHHPMGRKLGLIATLRSYSIGYLKLEVFLKHTYDALDSRWIDVDSIISTVTMAYQSSSKSYALG